jgi:YD repeat-containing protein
VDKVTRDVEQASAWLLDGAVARHGAHAVRADGRGRPIAVGDPACPDVRVAYDADGRVAKVATPDALWHVVGDVTIDVASPPGQAAIDACHTPTAATRWDRAEPATARIETSKSDGVDVASRIARSPAGGWSALGRLIPWWRPR